MENHIGRPLKKMLVFLPKTENQMLKNKKNTNRDRQPKTAIFQCKTDKTDLKNDQFILTKKPKIYGNTEYCTDLILGEVFCIFILYFPDSELSVLSGLHFYSHWHDTENREYVILPL